jgi:hypothetical protein
MSINMKPVGRSIREEGGGRREEGGGERAVQCPKANVQRKGRA